LELVVHVTCDTGPTSTKSSMSDNVSPVSKAFSTRDSVFMSPRSHLSPAIRVHGSVSHCCTPVHVTPVHVTLSCMSTVTCICDPVLYQHSNNVTCMCAADSSATNGVAQPKQCLVVTRGLDILAKYLSRSAVADDNGDELVTSGTRALSVNWSRDYLLHKLLLKKAFVHHGSFLGDSCLLLFCRLFQFIILC
jgi:hypothetical protein